MRSEAKVTGIVKDADGTVLQIFSNDYLPSSALKTRWVRAQSLGKYQSIAEKELERCIESPAWHPKTIKLRRNLYIIDVCGNSSGRGVHGVNLALIQDHPFLMKLNKMKYMPKSVKSVYRKEVRLAHYRANDGWHVFQALDLAQSAFLLWKVNSV